MFGLQNETNSPWRSMRWWELNAWLDNDQILSCVSVKYLFDRKKMMLGHDEGSRPEWCISSMLYSRDTPFWSGTLNDLLVICWWVAEWWKGNVWWTLVNWAAPCFRWCRASGSAIPVTLSPSLATPQAPVVHEEKTRSGEITLVTEKGRSLWWHGREDHSDHKGREDHMPLDSCGWQAPKTLWQAFHSTAWLEPGAVKPVYHGSLEWLWSYKHPGQNLNGCWSTSLTVGGYWGEINFLQLVVGMW